MWNDSYCVGNILEQSFQEIWNGEKATEFRQSLIDKTYKYCDTNICIIADGEPKDSPIADYPSEVSLCYDNTCVQQCVYCRDEPHVMSKEDQAKWDALIETDLIPMMQKAKLVTVNVAGEVFISEHSKKLIKRAAEVYPNIKFAIITNGILCSEENLKKLGIADKIVDIRISIPSIIEKTYNKIVRNGNYNSVMKNLEYVSELKKSGKINVFHMNCVLTSWNYKELIPITEYANKHGATLHVMIVKNMGQNTKFLRQLDKYLITDPNHPEYNEFVKIMNNPIIKDNDNFLINDSFKHLSPISFAQVIKNKVNFYKKYGWSKD
jgi:MoaA/NifB/PqqE/SkfB family radical SAM enzyme